MYEIGGSFLLLPASQYHRPVSLIPANTYLPEIGVHHVHTMFGAAQPAQYHGLLVHVAGGNVLPVSEPVIAGGIQALPGIGAARGDMVKVVLLFHVLAMQPAGFFQRAVPAQGGYGRHFGVPAVAAAAAQAIYQL